MLFKLGAVAVVELEAMPVAFLHNLLLVSLRRDGAGLEMARIKAQAHRPPHFGNLSLVGHQVDDREWGGLVEFCRIGAVVLKNVASKFNDHELHPQA